MVGNKFIKQTEKACKLIEGSLRGRSRLGHIVVVRHALSNLLRRELGYTYQEIGKIMNRNHATIIHSSKLHNTFWIKYNIVYSKLFKMFYYDIELERGNIWEYSIEKCDDEISKMVSLISSSQIRLKRIRRRKKILNR